MRVRKPAQESRGKPATSCQLGLLPPFGKVIVIAFIFIWFIKQNYELEGLSQACLQFNDTLSLITILLLK